jgi:hypothetical protein
MNRAGNELNYIGCNIVREGPLSVHRHYEPGAELIAAISKQAGSMASIIFRNDQVRRSPDAAQRAALRGVVRR